MAFPSIKTRTTSRYVAQCATGGRLYLLAA